MKRLGMKLLIIIAILYIGKDVFGIVVIDSTLSVLGFAIMLLVVNMFIKPILLLISLPITLLTFGLFSIIINTWMIMLTDMLISGIKIGSFWYGLIFAISFSLLNNIFVYNKKRE